MRHHPRTRSLLLLSVLFLTGCVSRDVSPPPALQPPPPPTPVTAPAPPEAQAFFNETGIASFYGAALDGNITANGQTFDKDAFTAAHPTLAFGTVVRVTNTGNGKMVKVAINDRGPNVKGRIIDLSSAAARTLGMEKNGITHVRLEAFRADQTPGD